MRESVKAAIKEVIEDSTIFSIFLKNTKILSIYDKNKTILQSDL